MNSSKFILMVLFCFAIKLAFSQELVLDNFSYQDNILTWQKVFESDLTIEEMKAKAKSLPIIETLISEDESSLTIDCKRIDHDFRALGGTEMNTSIYVSRKSSVGNVVFQFKEGRYRVTFANIILEQEYTVNAGMLTEKEGEQDLLADYALKGNRSNWRGVFKDKDYKIFDYSYSKLFDLSSGTALDDDF